MTAEPLRADSALQIKTPCPKSWGELVGDGRKRFCSECSLHVHNAAALSEAEAQSLVANASSRVCMRIEYDPQGAPIFREPAPHSRSARVARWALSAAAGVLAACHGSVSTSTPNDPARSANSAQSTSLMGKVQATEVLGDVAVHPPQRPATMGEAVVRPDPSLAPVPVAAPPKAGK